MLTSQILLVLTSSAFHLAQPYNPVFDRKPLCGESHHNGEAPRPKSLKYVMGDALVDRPDCVGPEGVPYPSAEIADLLPKLRHLQDNTLDGDLFSFPNSRGGRALFNQRGEAPLQVKERLLRAYGSDAAAVKGLRETVMEKNLERSKREAAESKEEMSEDKKEEMDGEKKEEEKKTSSEPASCPSSTPSRLCKTSFNTTAPMYGVSLTTGGVVTIVQKFPDLLQQVIFETCDKSQCDLIHGECVQTYTPYLFLVIPLGPVTLTGQDYVMVESGCTCRPKYSTDTAPNPLDVIPKFKA